MFKQMCGNPLAITVLACCRANPIQQRSLKDIYNLLLSDQIQTILKEEGVDSKTNQGSLTMSSESIIKLLRDNHPEALTFLYFLGMLPAGAVSE